MGSPAVRATTHRFSDYEKEPISAAIVGGEGLVKKARFTEDAPTQPLLHIAMLLVGPI